MVENEIMKKIKAELKVAEDLTKSSANTSSHDDIVILEPKKCDYLEVLRGCRSKCFQCNTIMQQVSSLIDELQDIRRYETQGLCTHCNQSGLPVGCRRCYHMISKYLSSKVQEYESRQRQYKEWLTKVKHVLHSILAVKNVYNREHIVKNNTANEELEKLLKQLQTPLTKTKRVLQIDHYPGKEFKVRQSQSQTDLLTESAIALEKVLVKLKTESETIANEKQRLSKSSKPSSPLEKGSFGSLPSLTTTYKVLPPIPVKTVKRPPAAYNKNSFALLPPSSDILQQNFKLKSMPISLKSTTLVGKNVKWGIGHATPHVGKAVSVVDKKLESGTYKKIEDRLNTTGAAAKGTGVKSALKNRIGDGLRRSTAGEIKSRNKEKKNVQKLQIDQNVSKLKPTSFTFLTSVKRQELKTFAKESGIAKEEKNKQHNKFLDEKVGEKQQDDVEVILEKESEIKENEAMVIGSKESVVVTEISITPSTSRNLLQNSVIVKGPLLKVPLLSMKFKAPLSMASTIPPIREHKLNAVVQKDEEQEDVKKNAQDKEDPAGPKKLRGLAKGHSKLSKEYKKTKKKENEDDGYADSLDNDIIQDKENRSNNKPAKKGKKIKHSASTKLFMRLLKEKEKERTMKEKLEKVNAKAKPIVIPVIKKMSLPILGKGKRNNDEGSLDSIQTPQIRAGNYIDFPCTYDKMIRGTGIVPFEPPITNEVDNLPKPLLFRRVQGDCPAPRLKTKNPTSEVKGDKGNLGYNNILYPQSAINVHGDTKGIFKYELSNREYIDKGITKLPSMKIMRKMNIYKMVPTHVGKMNWFERHKKDRMFYESGERLAACDGDGHGRWYYRNGKLALDYYAAEEIYAGHRYVIYSSGEKDGLGISTPVTVLASFDHIGNGVVYDDKGNVRLKYNQSEGVVVDVNIGPPGRWKWHSLNDPPVLLPVYVEHPLELEERDREFEELITNTHHHIDECTKVANEEMLAVEFENYVKEKTTKLLQKYKPFQIRIKAFKVNKEFSLHVIDQANIYLLFRDSHVSLKLNLGMLLDNKEILDTEASDVTHVMTPYDRQIPRSNSVAHIKRIIVDTKRKFDTQVSKSQR